MKYVIAQEEKDIKGNPRIRYCCPGCAGTIGVSPVGIRLKLGGNCRNCGAELVMNPEGFDPEWIRNREGING